MALFFFDERQKDRLARLIGGACRGLLVESHAPQLCAHARLEDLDNVHAILLDAIRFDSQPTPVGPAGYTQDASEAMAS